MWVDGFQNCNEPAVAILPPILPLLDGSLLWLSCHRVTIVHTGRVGAYNLSL